MRKTLRLCKKCGGGFYGNSDSLYCQSCVGVIRADVVRTRACIDCGASFDGGPRAMRCPKCRVAEEKRINKLHKKSGSKRKLGSIDICQICGTEYIVKSGRQKYCPGCRREASLQWQREHKKEYNKKPEVIKARRERRSSRQKICVYCLLPFWDSSTSNCCSDYCRAQNKKIKEYQADIKRGHKCSIESLLRARDEYRESVKNRNQF